MFLVTFIEVVHILETSMTYIILVSILHMCSSFVISSFAFLEVVVAQFTIPKATFILRALSLLVIQTCSFTSRAHYSPERFSP